MKTLIIALALAGITCGSAQAQTKTGKMVNGTCVCNNAAKQTTKKVAHAKPKTTQTSVTSKYQVCKNMGGYYSCCVHHNTVTKTTTKPAANATAMNK